MNVQIDKNPFQITTPEDLSAKETVSLFVDVFTDFQKIIDSGHVFLMGPRGVGKSMMFRYLQPDCQCLAKNCTFSELPFLGVYIPLKNTNFALSELKRLEDRHASDILNEHILVTHFCVMIFSSLAKKELYSGNENSSATRQYFCNKLLPSLGFSYLDDDDYVVDDSATVSDVFSKIEGIFRKIYINVMNYVKRLSFTSELLPYEGPLYDYLGFLIPLLSDLSKIDDFPKGTIYLLIDDAHCLSNTQTRVLNSWVSTRTSRKISLKISSQYNYKTYYTVTGVTIDTPHDYSEVDMATIYTGSSKSKYRNRIADIVNKRLVSNGINLDVEQFFPVDEEQEKSIKEIEEFYKERFDRGEGRGNKRTDDAIRYSRPDFIRNLAGSRKSSSTYSYAGFNQLVHLSSGIVRYFLEPAHIMFAKEKSQAQKDSMISFISPSVQNEVLREEANKFLFYELDKLRHEGHSDAIPAEDVIKLSNLIQGLGGLFRQILISDRSERRIFSVAISDIPSYEVDRIMELGVQLGYFHKSTIGRKNSGSGGRTKLYVMNRRLSPIWNLDPTGFAGYLFVKSNFLEKAMIDPQRLLYKFMKDGSFQDDDEHVQMSFFDDTGETAIELIDEED